MSDPFTIGPGPKLLARYLERIRATSPRTPNEITARSSGADVEASEEQKQIWLHAQLAGNAKLYNEPFTLYHHGDLNPSALERAFNEILRRHEAWRTSFQWRESKLLQVVAHSISVELPVIDLRSLREKHREARALELAGEDAKQPFDLAKPPLLRYRLIRFADLDYRVYLTLHHIIFDGFSISRVFLPELQVCYSAFASGKSPSLEELPFQYSDYSLWRREWLARGGADQDLEYWNNQLLENLPLLELPLDRPRQALRSFNGARKSFIVPKDVAERLKEVAKVQNTTFFVTLLAAFHVLLYSYSFQNDQVIGVPSSSRQHSSTERLLGLFINTLVIRTAFVPYQPFLELVSRVRAVTVEALSHNAALLSMLVSRYCKTRKPGVSPFFQVLFTLEPPRPPGGSEWRIGFAEVDTGTSKFDLSLIADEQEGLACWFVYNNELFDPSTIDGMSRRFTLLLARIGTDPCQSVSSLCDDLADSINRISAAQLREKDIKNRWYGGFWSKLLDH